MSSKADSKSDPKGHGQEETWRLTAGQPYYGTFQGDSASNYASATSYQQQQHTVIGIPQPAPPPGAIGQGQGQYAYPYQAVPAYPGYHSYTAAVVVEQRPVERPQRLPCCGIGIGWALFIAGFFLATVPWYVGAFILMCVRRTDHREKSGLLACTIAAILSAIAIILGATKGAEEW